MAEFVLDNIRYKIKIENAHKTRKKKVVHMI